MDTLKRKAREENFSPTCVFLQWRNDEAMMMRGFRSTCIHRETPGRCGQLCIHNDKKLERKNQIISSIELSYI